jgi:hypothetical protein
MTHSVSNVSVSLSPSAQPMHWIYNLDSLKEVLSKLEPFPEFRAESANPFYRRETGEQTCYGDQAFVLLESLSHCGGTDTHIHTNTQSQLLIISPSSEESPYMKLGC